MKDYRHSHGLGIPQAVVQVAELTVENGELHCDRDAQATWPLP